jgi:hypothetical protein
MSSTDPLANQVKGSMFNTMDKMGQEVAAFANKDQLSEMDMIKFNMAASRYSMVTNLTSNLVKELTEAEKQIAQKM